MTKEEIIDNLELYTVGRLKKDQVSITVEELQNLIDEIKALEQQPCDDCVSRQALINSYNVIETPVGYRKVVDMQVVEDIPPVTPTRKVGKWIKTGGSFRCSECMVMPEFKDIRALKYCPNCGADMRGGENG